MTQVQGLTNKQKQKTKKQPPIVVSKKEYGTRQSNGMRRKSPLVIIYTIYALHNQSWSIT